MTRTTTAGRSGPSAASSGTPAPGWPRGACSPTCSPQRRLDPPTSRLLSAWFEALQVFRFPDPEYATFRQIVILGRRKAAPALDPEAQDRLSRLRAGDLPPLAFR